MAFGETALIVLLALPFAGSIVAMLFPANARNAEAWLAGSIALAALLVAFGCYEDVARGEVLRMAVPWVPARALDFSLRMDGYAWMFSVIVSGIGFLIVLYARYYMSPQDPVPRFFSFLLAFMGSMLGVVLAGNLIVMVFFWELTSIASFLLKRDRTRRRAHGAGRDLGGRAVPARGRADPGAHRRQLRSRPCARFA
jgi:multicomponent K+:H+ antiporter subunit A